MISAYPFSTAWTGAGDGTAWSDPANWTNGVPLTGVNAPTSGQDIATIDNTVDKTPFTLAIAGQVGAGEVDINLVDPTGGVAVKLTGALSLSTNVTSSGSGFGVLNLDSGTFEIDGGTLGGGDIFLKGGTLAFGSYSQWGVDTLAGAIIDGNVAINNASTVVIQKSGYAIFDGLGGSGKPAADTISGGAMVSVLGSLYLDGTIAVQNGTLSLDGGTLYNWGGPGTLYADGGALKVTQSFTVSGDFTFEGGVTFTGAETISVAAGGELTLGAMPASPVAPTVVNLDGGTIDVTGALNLENTVLKNGTLILESGSTYIVDGTSSLSGVTVTDNRPAGQTNWTGAAGDGKWSNAANWTKGVPQSGVGFTSDGQSVAVVNDIIDTVPSTIVISGTVNAQDIAVATTDPANAPSVSLTGTLDTSYSGEGGAHGDLNLASGAFEIDGGTLSYTSVGINGGALAFGNIAVGQAKLNNDILNGTWGAYNSVIVLTGSNVFDGQGGSGPTTVTLDGGAQLLEVTGTLALDGELDIKDGTDGTLFSLDGGNLSGFGGDAATILIDGGTFAIDANTTFSNAVNAYGGYMVFGAATDTLTVDASSVTSIGKAGANQTTVNLNGGTIAVFGTLDLTNTHIENGTIIVETGAVLNQDATDVLSNVTVSGAQTVTNWTGGVINNTNNTINAGNTPFSLVVGETIKGGTIIDPNGNVTFAGGILGGLTYRGALDLSQDSASVIIDGGLTVQDSAGNSPGTINLDGYQSSLTFDDTQTFDNATINLTNGQAGIFTTIGNAQFTAGGQIAIPLTLTLGAAAVINSSGYNDILGNPQGYNTSYGATTLINNGTINVTSGSLEIDPSTFTNNGKITVAAGATLDLEGNWSNPGTVSVAPGATIELGGSYTDATLATFNQSGNTLEINGTLDNSAGILNVGTGATYAQLSLFAGGTIKGGTINDAGGGLVFAGGTLDNVTYDGTINLTQGNVTAYFSNGLKVAGVNGTGSGVIDLAGYNDSLLFNDTQTFDNATVNLGGANGGDTLAGLASAQAFKLAGNVATNPTLTLGSNLEINQLGGYNYLGGLDPYNTALNNLDFGTTTLVNSGIISVTSGTLVVNSSSFINKGTITVSSGATLFLDGNWSNLGTISLASGSIINVGGTFTAAKLAQFNLPGVTIEIGGTLDNSGAILNVGSGQTYSQLTLESGGSVKGGTVNDSGGVIFNGGTLDGVTYDSAIDLTAQYQSLGVADGSVFKALDGTSAGSITLAGYDQTLNFYNTQTVDNLTINLTGLDDQIQVSNNTQPANSPITLDSNLTFGINTVINSNGAEFIYGSTGNGLVINQGTINDQTGTLKINPTNFLNSGTINVASGANLYLDGKWSNTGTIADNGGNVFLGGNFDDAAIKSITNNGSALYIDGTLNNVGNILTVGQGTALPLIKLNDGAINGGTISDAGSGLALYGVGTLNAVTYDGVFNLSGTGFYTYYYSGSSYTSPALIISNGFSLTGANGTGPGQLNVLTTGVPLNFTGIQTFDNATVNLGNSDSINAYSDYHYTALATLTLGTNLIVDVSGGSASYNEATFGGAGTIINDGTINVTSGLFAIDPANFSNVGTINVAAGATLYLQGNWSNTGTINLAAGSSVYLQGSFNAASVSHIVNNGGTIFATTIAVPGAVGITQSFSAAISGISLTDPGAASGQTVTATLTDATGLLSATGTGVSGSGTTKLVVSGTLAQVNAALATLTDSDPVVGTDVITVAAVDSSGNSAANKTVNVYVTSAIFISTPTEQVISQNLTTLLNYAYVSEEGALSGAALTVTVSDTSGILSATGSGVSGSGTNVLTISGSQTLINTELATLAINEANPGTDTVTFAAQDAAGDKAQSTNIAITTVASPTIGAPASEAVTQNSIAALSGFSVGETGSLPYESFTVTVSDTSGLLSATGSAAAGLGATSITVIGSLSQVNADLATLTLDDPNAGTDTLHMTVTDSLGGTSSQSVAIASTHVPSPDLTVGAITAPAAGIEGQTVQLTWTVTNSGDATATGPWTDNVYLASDAAGTSKSLVGSFTYTGTLNPGQSATETQTITVPSTFTISTQTGTAATYFVVQADSGNQTGALSGFRNHLGVAIVPTVVTATVNWAQIFAEVKPAGIDATDYALIEQRFVAEVGTTDASFATAINTTIAALDTTSTTPATSNDAMTLLLRQAVGGLVDQTLVQVNAASASGTGLDALLTPSSGSDLASRNNSGVFGDDWASEFNDFGPLGPMNGFGPGNQNSGDRGYVQEYITTYVDQYDNYLGQSISYQIVAPAHSGINFLDSSSPYSNYTQTNPNGTIETFSGTSGLLIAISDGTGNAIAINRNATGIITSITTASGHPPTFTVNALGKITSATSSAGNTITYMYDLSGAHLLSTTSLAGTTSYQYSASSNAFIQNALTQVTNLDGSTQSYGYNAQGDIVSQSINGATPITYSYFGANTITQTNGDGQVATRTYDANGQTTSITVTGGNTVAIQRDGNGNATSITTAAGQTYHYGYNSSGNLTSLTDPSGHIVLYGYAAGTFDLTSATDQNGNKTQYMYNSAGQFSGLSQANGTGTQYIYSAAGKISQKTEASGAIVQYSYNAAGQVTNEQFSDSTSQSYTYNAIGNLTSSTAVSGGVSTYAYNAQGLLANVTNGAGQVEQYSYNAAGQETQRVEPDGSVTNFAYYATGLLAQITDGSGSIIASYTYDTTGVLIAKATGNGASTVYSHDAKGNLTEIKTLATDGSTTSKIDYTFDMDDRIVTATSGDGTWTYSYDANNQLAHAVFASNNASIASQDLTYHYDAAGNRNQTVFNGATTNYATNNLNQYTSIDGTTFSYDANGNLLTKVSSGNTKSYTYNVQNQMVSSTDASGTTAYTYDALGNMSTQTISGVKTSYVSDPLAINSTATGPLSAIAQAYNASGQSTATYTYGNGLTAITSSGTTSYYNADASGNITSLSGVNGALAATYAYTPSGSLLNSTGSVVNPFQFNGGIGAMTEANGLVNTRARYYDPTTGRFMSADPAGQSGGVNLYTYGANNPVNYIDATGNSVSLFGVFAGLVSIAVVILAAPVEATVAAFVLPTLGLVTGVTSIYQAVTKPGDPRSIYPDKTEDYASGVLSLGGSFLGVNGVLKPFANGFVTFLSNANSVASLTDGYGSIFTYYGDAYANWAHPPIDGTVTVNVPQGGGHGDVHLTTFDGLHYDFQAVGEFVLAKSTAVGDTFQVQIRLADYGGGESSPTVTTEMGIQVGNDRVSFCVGRTATVWVDGVASNLSPTANTLTLAGGTITELSQGNYQVTERTGEVVQITDSGTYLGYTIDLAPSVKPGSVAGLLGTYTGTANAFQLPNGTALGSNLTSVQLYQTFGNAWRITDGTSLLDYGTGENTATYTDLTHPSYGLPVSSLPTDVVAAAKAAVAAAGITDPTAAADATYDYLVTGNPSFITSAAATGALAPVTSTAVVTPSAPPPPSIGISPSTPMVTELSGQTPVTFTVSLTSAATADTVVNYTVSVAAIDAGKSYFSASDFGGTLPSGTITILKGQSEAQFTVNVPDTALGSIADKWLAVGISTPGVDPIYASAAQVDIFNNAPVAGVAAQPVLEYVPGNVVAATQNTPTLTHTGNSYSLNLGNVVQGTSPAALQFALANMAAAPADSLVATVLGATGSGFNQTGLLSATLIHAGSAYAGDILQPLTANLGAQSETVTLGARDVNSTGYSGALPNITLTVTENVIAAAKASISSNAIVLADVRVGSTGSQTITVTNTAATGAASLDVTLAAATGATATGLIAQLAAGASDSTSLSVGLLTTSAGLQTSFVTLNLASDLGNGVEVPLALNQSVGLTGSVYRSAAATITQAATIVHVGDPGSQAISISNSDPADGYSEALRATVTGTTGNISASGTTGLIDAGTTNASSISVGYSTATAGLVSGQVNLGLTSDGTGIDALTPISLGSDPVSFSVQVDNYAKADLHETSGGGTLSGSAAAGYQLDLGTIAQGSGPATVDLAALNSASGLADLLSGSLAVSGDSAFTNSGFGAFGGLGAGQADSALVVSLSTQNNGTLSETITLTGAGSNASGYSGAVAPVTLTIHGQVASNTPVIAGGTTASGAITELAGTTGSAIPDTTTGTIGFTDANLTASHTAAVLSVNTSGMTTGLPGKAALLSLLSLGNLTEDTASNPGHVAWNFAAADDTFDYLGAGQSLTLTYAVQIAEKNGGAVTQDVTVVVTGTNDLPMIAVGTTAAVSLTAIVASAKTPIYDTANGTVRFTDADLGDIHSASVTAVAISGATSGLPASATLLGLLSTSSVTEPAGATSGSVGWNFSAPDATFAYLAPEQSVTLTYTVDVSDNHGGTVAQSVAVNVTGAAGTVVHSTTSGSVAGTAYANVDNAYTAAGFLYLKTFYGASGNVLGTGSYLANGSNAVTLGGVMVQAKTVASDGSYVVYYTNSGNILGVPYASTNNSHAASGFQTLQVFYDTSGHVVGTRSYVANGGYTITIGGTVVQVETINSDGSYLVENDNITGKTYTQSDLAYNAAGTQIAVNKAMTNGSSATTLIAAGQTLSIAAGVETLTIGADTFQLGANTHGTLDITGAANATLAFGMGDGAQIITGFATTGAGADVLSFSHTVFADYAYLMGATKQQGSDLLITLDANDTLLLKNVTMSNFTTSNAHFT